MDQAKLMRVGEAAKASETKRTTLIAAISRGELRSYKTACGLPLVRLHDVRKWASQTRRIGRPPATT